MLHLVTDKQVNKKRHYDHNRGDNGPDTLSIDAETPDFDQQFGRFRHDAALLSEKSEERIVLVRGYW
jgi:hypothetical protein